MTTRPARAVAGAVAIVLLAAACWLLWPTQLGGRTGYAVIVGDDDGVLFIPVHAAGTLLTLADTIHHTERQQAERIRTGESLRSQVQFGSYLARRREDPSLTFRSHLRAVGGAVEE